MVETTTETREIYIYIVCNILFAKYKVYSTANLRFQEYSTIKNILHFITKLFGIFRNMILYEANI